MGEGSVEEHVGLGIENVGFGGEGDEGIVNVEPLVLVPLVAGVMPGIQAAHMRYHGQELVVGSTGALRPGDTDNVKGSLLGITIGLVLLPVVGRVSMQIQSHREGDVLVNLYTRCPALKALQVHHEDPRCRAQAHPLVDIGDALPTVATGVRVHGHGLGPRKVLQAVLDAGHVVAVVEEVKGDVQEGIICLCASPTHRAADIALEDAGKEAVDDAVAVVLGATQGTVEAGAEAEEELVGVLLLVAGHFGGGAPDGVQEVRGADGLLVAIVEADDEGVEFAGHAGISALGHSTRGPPMSSRRISQLVADELREMEQRLKDAVHEAGIAQVVQAPNTDAVLGEDAAVQVFLVVCRILPAQEAWEEALAGGGVDPLQVLVPDEHAADYAAQDARRHLYS